MISGWFHYSLPYSDSEIMRKNYLYFLQRTNCIILSSAKILMGASAPGALNAQGFSQAINSKQLPDYNHITHSGIFN